MDFIILVAAIFVDVLLFAMIARGLLSWIPELRRGQLGYYLDRITEPLITPMRRIFPPMGMFDTAFMATTIILIVISSILHSKVSG